jgi:hypothetical protein
MGRTKERRVAQRLADKGVAGWITREIGFGFHDPTGCDAVIAISNYDAADQGSGECSRPDRQ